MYLHIPGTQVTSIFEGQPPKTRSFPTKTRVIWVLGIYVFTYMDRSDLFSRPQNLFQKHAMFPNPKRGPQGISARC